MFSKQIALKPKTAVLKTEFEFCLHSLQPPLVSLPSDTISIESTCLLFLDISIESTFLLFLYIFIETTGVCIRLYVRVFWSPFLNWGAQSAIFCHLKTGTFAKSWFWRRFTLFKGQKLETGGQVRKMPQK